jgi:hypothetical protein
MLPICPRCGDDLIRVHRRGVDRLVDVVVPVRRYGCPRSNCRYSALSVSPRRLAERIARSRTVLLVLAASVIALVLLRWLLAD